MVSYKKLKKQEKEKKEKEKTDAYVRLVRTVKKYRTGKCLPEKQGGITGDKS